VIISVGYRVHSHRGTQFRIWATQRLREYIIKGFALDDERLKRAGGGNYFDELLARIRDIRSSEKLFWRKALDIYATSMDCEPSSRPAALRRDAQSWTLPRPSSALVAPLRGVMPPRTLRVHPRRGTGEPTSNESTRSVGVPVTPRSGATSHMHWAAHGHTAAEIIAARADACRSPYVACHGKSVEFGAAMSYHTLGRVPSESGERVFQRSRG